MEWREGFEPSTGLTTRNGFRNRLQNCRIAGHVFTTRQLVDDLNRYSVAHPVRLEQVVEVVTRHRPSDPTKDRLPYGCSRRCRVA